MYAGAVKREEKGLYNAARKLYGSYRRCSLASGAAPGELDGRRARLTVKRPPSRKP